MLFLAARISRTDAEEAAVEAGRVACARLLSAGR